MQAASLLTCMQENKSWPKSPPYLRHISTTSPYIWQENNAREIVQQLAADPHYFGTLCISPTSPPYLPTSPLYLPHYFGTLCAAPEPQPEPEP